MYTLTILLFIGYLIIGICSLINGFSIKAILKTSFDGIYQIRTIILLLCLIGVLSSCWRASATIPTMVYYLSGLFSPKVTLLMCFYINCLMSMLTGSSFGTAATAGIITMSIASSMGLSSLFSAGAILSGIYFGDRCSPVSTSALLISETTKTNLYANIRRMFKTGLIPFIFSSIIYLVLGIFSSDSESAFSFDFSLFFEEFNITSLNIIPVLVVIILAILKVNIRISISLSILCSITISIAMQGYLYSDIIHIIFYGFNANNESLARLFDGGGIISMINIIIIVSISSTYAGLLEKTSLFKKIRTNLELLSNHVGCFSATLITSCIIALISCNQTLTIILTNQLCEKIYGDKSTIAIDLEDTAALVPALVPWSIACAVPLSTIGATGYSIIFAFYLYLLPLFRVLFDQTTDKHTLK